jgi:SAM-dependent methyltransferase
LAFGRQDADSCAEMESGLMRFLTAVAELFRSLRSRAAGAARPIDQPVPAKAPPLRFPLSQLALKYLEGLEGLEIGGSAHNHFGLNTKNVDFTGKMDTVFKRSEVELCGEALPVDIVASGDELPVPDESQDFVISSHVIEHFFDPIKTLQEWIRVVRPGGYIFIIAPHKERTFDKERPRTTLKELIDRHEGRIPSLIHDTDHHYSVWITEDLLELCQYLGLAVVEYQDVDDKVGNGFTIVVRKEGDLSRQSLPAAVPRRKLRRAA